MFLSYDLRVTKCLGFRVESAVPTRLTQTQDEYVAVIGACCLSDKASPSYCTKSLDPLIIFGAHEYVDDAVTA